MTTPNHLPGYVAGNIATRALLHIASTQFPDLTSTTEAVDRHKSTVYSLLDRLQAKGLVTRSAGERGTLRTPLVIVAAGTVEDAIRSTRRATSRAQAKPSSRRVPDPRGNQP